MNFTEVLSLSISVLTLGAMIFGVFFYFRNPQEKIEKKQLVNEERDKNKAEKNSVDILETKFKIYLESTEKKFCELSGRLGKNLTYNQNHLHTVDEKLGIIKDEMNSMKVDIGSKLTKLETIIEERIPKKV